MELYFTCPTTGELFASAGYALVKGHIVVESKDQKRELKGRVVLTEPCPLCGNKHRYEVKDVLCPLTGDTNEE